MKLKKFFDIERKRLLIFHKSKHKNFWDTHWLKHQEILGNSIYKFDPNSIVCKSTIKFLNPYDGPILEGGCGLGLHVYSLTKMNYEVIGIDNAEKTIEFIKKKHPELKIELGDVRQIPYPNNFFAGYWSLGVIEYFFNGYLEIISEMKRVIKPNGFLFITFPYMSPFRKFKARFHLFKTINTNRIEDKKTPEFFYQYALNKWDVIKDFKNSGFKLKYLKPFDGIKGFKDEIFVFKDFIKKFFELIYNVKKVKLLMKIMGLIDQFLLKFSAHVILLVFQKI